MQVAFLYPAKKQDSQKIKIDSQKERERQKDR